MNMDEWEHQELGDLGHFGSWARSQLTALEAEELALYGIGDDYTRQELAVATSRGSYVASLSRTDRGQFESTAELTPWSEVKVAGFAFTGLDEHP